MHPDMFSAFEDIAGDLSPNSGDRAQTIDRLFGGNAAAYASFDPSTVIASHGAYTGVTGWFDTNVAADQRRMTRRRRRTRCAHWAVPTASSARWSPSPASTTGRSRRTRSRRRCRGWPVRSARQTSRRSRCPIHRRPRPSPRRRRRRTCRRPRNRAYHCWAAVRASSTGSCWPVGVNSFHSPGTPLSTWAPQSLKRDSRTVDEVFDSVRHEHFPCAGLRSDSCRDVDGDPTDVVAAPLTLTGMQTTANIDAYLRHAVCNCDGAQNRSRGAVERRQYSVAGVLDDSTLEKIDLGTGDFVVAVQAAHASVGRRVRSRVGWSRRCR